jgi:hypothetical protein
VPRVQPRRNWVLQGRYGKENSPRGTRKVAARAHGNDLLPCLMNSDEGGASVILWLRKEVG